MSQKISVVVQSTHQLFDDKGQMLCPDGTAYQVEETDLIKQYIHDGLLAVEAQIAEAPAPATEEPKTLNKSKARASAQEQENSDG
jgi:hypothetical protein